MPSYPYALTITNPGAETGNTSGWTDVTSALGVRTTGTGGLASHSGGWYFIATASGASAECYQDIALDSSLYSDIDAGLLRIRFDGWHAGSGSDSDNGKLTITFLDVSSAAIGGERAQDNIHTGAAWVKRTLLVLVPPNTRTVRLGMKGTRTGGTALDSYWDDLAAQLELASSALGVVGCDLYLTGSAITEGNGSAIPTWNDSSGVGNHVSAAGTARPLSRPSGTVGLNGKPAAEASNADGAYDKMTNLEACQYGGNTGMTIFAVIEHDLSIGTTDGDIVGRTASGNLGYRLSIQGTGELFFQVSSSPSARTQRTGSIHNLLGAPYLVTARYNGATGEQSLWINGVQDDATLSAAVPASVGNTGPALGVFGVENSRFKGHMGDLLVFGRALTDAERLSIEAQLLARYNLYKFVKTADSPDVTDIQGVARDGSGGFFTVGTGAIHKRDGSWATVATNSSPFASLSGSPDHCGDSAYYSGHLYVPVEKQVAPNNGQIVRYDGSSLAFVDTHDISAQAFEPAALCIDPVRGRIWVGSFQNDDQLKLWYYDLSTFAYLGALTVSQELTLLQGLTYNPIEDSLWASLNDSRLMRINPTTGVVRPVYRRKFASEAEGVDFTAGTTFYWLFDNHIVQVFGPPLVAGGVRSVGQMLIAAL
jgi:hypothetical protein